MKHRFLIMIIAFCIFATTPLLKTPIKVHSYIDTPNYEDFRDKYPLLTAINTEVTKNTYTDQQLAKIAVIKKFAGLSQARLYKRLQILSEISSSFRKILDKQTENGFDQKSIASKLDDIDRDIRLVSIRIKSSESLYANLEMSFHTDIKPRYDQLLFETESSLTQIDEIQIALKELISENQYEE